MNIHIVVFRKSVNRESNMDLCRVTKVVADLGWVDLYLVSSLDRWAATVATYCPSQMVQHPKSNSTQPRSATTFVTLY